MSAGQPAHRQMRASLTQKKPDLRGPKAVCRESDDRTDRRFRRVNHAEGVSRNVNYRPPSHPGCVVCLALRFTSVEDASLPASFVAGDTALNRVLSGRAAVCG